jgi:4-hydroxy-4-methyl-2-oxoglutarate aldolase
MLSENTRAQLQQLSTPLVVDAMDRLGLQEAVLDPAIRPVEPNTRMVGTAVTVLMRSQTDRSKASLGRYSEALENTADLYCPIIVVEVPEEHHHRGIFGEGAAMTARHNGFVGALVDGAVRDTPDLQRMQYPVFSRNVSPGYAVGKVEAVSRDEPVRIGGVTVHPGDIIVADNDGVVIVSPDRLEDVINRAQAIREWENKVHQLMQEGLSIEEAINRVGEMP